MKVWRWARSLSAVDPILILAGVAAAAVFLVVALVRDLTSLEALLFQLIGIAAGVTATYRASQSSARRHAQELIEATARPAVRRLESIARSLQRLGGEVNLAREDLTNGDDGPGGAIDPAQVDFCFGVLSDEVLGQIQAASDAIEDWRDIAPSDVDAVTRRAREMQDDDAG